MKPKREKRRRGSSLIEFTFVGIPMLFVLISVFEISRGMWMYHTLAYSVRVGVRYSVVHGYNCTRNGNACSVTIANTAQIIKDAAVGLDPSLTQLRFYTGPSDPAGAVKSLVATCLLSTCSSNATQFPPDGTNNVGQPITIDIQTPFTSALAMFWPGSTPTKFSSTIFPASSTDTIQF